MSDFIDITKDCISDCPNDFIPAGAKQFIGVDLADDGAEATVVGFFDPKTGKFHVQEYQRTEAKK